MKMKVLMVLLSIVLLSQCQVLGIDFGTEFWKASLISPGKNLVIVENSRSGRKTINGIAIMEGVRHFQDDALYKRLKKPHMSYFYLNKLLRSLDHDQPLSNYHFQNGTYFITHNQDKISLEQLVGMILKNVKLHAINQAGSQIKDCVLAVPASWGWKARMALVNAASVAGLNVLGLVNENSAAAINFAITRNDTDALNVGFFNLGSHNLQFSIMQFYGLKDEGRNKNIESLRVLSHVVVEDVGGLSIDRAIADYLADKFKKVHGLDPRTKQKAYVKLLHEAAEAKETLSANKEVQVYVEGLMDGIDLNFPLTREVIQSLPAFKSLHSHLDLALTKANITRSQLHSVEMIGGASRIPLVSKIVKEHFNEIQVGSHINGDEAMAFGSALRAANLSIAFRVKELHFYDGFDQNINCVIRDSVNQQQIYSETLFTHDSQHADKAFIHLSPPKNDILVDLYYGEKLVKTYQTVNVTQWQQYYNETTHNFTTHPNLVLGFVLSTVNIVELKEAYVNLTFERVQIREVEDWVEEEEKLEEQVVESKNEGTTQQQPQVIESQKNVTSEENSEKNTTDKQPKKKLVKITKQVEEKKLVNKKHSVLTNETFCEYRQYSRQQIVSNQQILLRFEKHESYLREKSKIRNDLESILYRLRNSFEEPYLTKFSTEEQLQNLKKVVSQKLQWLDENAWTAEKDDFEKQFNHLYVAYEPMYNRSIEYNERQKKYNETIHYLSFTYQKTLELNKTHSWLEDKIVEHLQRINSTVQAIHEKLKKQSQQELNVNPLIYNNQMLKMAEQLRDQYYLMRLIPRPKKEKTPKQEQQNVQNGQNQTNNASKSSDDADQKEQHAQEQADNSSDSEKKQQQEKQATQQTEESNDSQGQENIDNQNVNDQVEDTLETDDL